ncbi:MAG TPA: class I SAM-dependent methyltransferase [Trebonia sp.]|nr:class I SAM-dependent methyltransferase [Trebonia sp.]
MGFYSNQVVPRLVDKVMANKEFEPIRARVAAGLDGEVVEIGFGSGLNLPHYPPAVRRVRAVDPATLGRKLAAERLAAAPVPVEFVGLDGQRLPLADDSADYVLATWTLCSIPQPDLALAEIRRVLRPGGAFHFVEHGRHPDPKVARWQDRLTPLQRLIAGGCHLNRPIDALVRSSGLELAKVSNYEVFGRKVTGYMYEGVATKPEQPPSRDDDGRA